VQLRPEAGQALSAQQKALPRLAALQSVPFGGASRVQSHRPPPLEQLVMKAPDEVRHTSTHELHRHACNASVGFVGAALLVGWRDEHAALAKSAAHVSTVPSASRHAASRQHASSSGWQLVVMQLPQVVLAPLM
jgi:hypothetical protein